MRVLSARLFLILRVFWPAYNTNVEKISLHIGCDVRFNREGPPFKPLQRVLAKGCFITVAGRAHKGDETSRRYLVLCHFNDTFDDTKHTLYTACTAVWFGHHPQCLLFTFWGVRRTQKHNIRACVCVCVRTRQGWRTQQPLSHPIAQVPPQVGGLKEKYAFQ